MVLDAGGEGFHIATMAGVTLRQIAEMAGCSRSTVSYALNNNPNISPETRARVLKVAEELGWRPDAELARQMALVRSTVIKSDLPKLAIVINKSRESLEDQATPRLQLTGAIDYAEKMGYSADVFNLAEQPLTARRLREILVARGVQGIVFVATVEPDLPEEYLAIGENFACAIAGMRFPNLPFHVVINDFLSAGRISIQKMLEAGARRPAAIIPRGLDRILGYGFTGGIWSGLMDVPEEERLAPLHVGTDESHIPPYEYERVQNWLGKNRPDAVITTDIPCCRKILKEMAGQGPMLPLYSLDWTPHQAVSGGVDCRQTYVGRAAVDSVVAQLHRGECGLPEVQRVVQIEGAWATA